MLFLSVGTVLKRGKTYAVGTKPVGKCGIADANRKNTFNGFKYEKIGATGAKHGKHVQRVQRGKKAS